MCKDRKIVCMILIISCLVIYNMTSSVYASGMTMRLAGGDRYSTAVEISKYGWQESKNAVLATGDEFPDALCAAPLARQLDAPILLSGRSSLEKGVNEELNRLGVENVYIIGGTGVISEAVEKQLAESGMKVKRLFGVDRYETSLAVADYIADNAGSGFKKEIVVATGDDFPDALSIAAIAAKKGMPIILSPKSELPQNVVKYVMIRDIDKSYVIGGSGVISESVEKSLPSPSRISGSDRYATNIAVLNTFAGELELNTVYLATGNDYPDALAGSALAPKTSSPIVLVDKISQDGVKNFMTDKFTSIKQVRALGGEGVISDATLEYVVPKVIVLSVNDISATVAQGKEYKLPSQVTAAMSDGSVEEVPVVWSPAAADTSKEGTYAFIGTVKDYSKKVTLTLSVYAPHPILGKADVTAEKMAKFLLDNNPEPKLIGVTALELAQMFLEEGEIEGVRGDIAFCQSIHETGWFKYGGQVLPEQNNYAGIGATNNSPVGKGAWFTSPREGVRAQIQHLKAYASKEPLKQTCVDPRYDILKQYNLLGIAPNWEDLNGRWAVPGTTYGQSIMALYERMKTEK